LRLYHGTVDRYVPSILAGVDVSRGRRKIDFGRGFYTTTAWHEAVAWAGQVARRQFQGRARATVIQFDVPRDAIASLDTLWFVRAGRDAEDYWAFVDYCRRGMMAHRPDRTWYDLVVGPVTQNWRYRLMVADSDQISFHTARAAALLNACNPREVTTWPAGVS
jgi:hypothetical protein